MPINHLKKAVRHQNEKTQILDEETQEVLANIRIKDARFRRTAIIFFSILFLIGVVGIYYQNKLAHESKQHLDCIVKLLATPSTHGQTRQIVDLSTCQIEVN